MEVFLIILSVLLAYLLGSIPTSVWIGRIFYHVDVRTQGSGNAGATNTIRVLGWKAGVPVMVLDVFKGWLAVYLSHCFYGAFHSVLALDQYKIMLAAAAVLGHVFPVYVGFRGGKGIATLLGVGLALYPLAAFIAVIIFLLVLFATGYVSVGSIVAAITFPVIEILVLGHQDSIPLMILAVFVAIFVPFTHRKNIGRLIRGEESKFIRRKKKSDPAT